VLAYLVNDFSGVNAYLLYVAWFAVPCECGPANCNKQILPLNKNLALSTMVLGDDKG
jgi:hypothetical protein